MFFYLLRILFMVLRQLIWPKKPRNVFEKGIESATVWPSDVDYLLHMNNAVYSTKFEFGRTDFWLRNGGYLAARRLKNSRTNKLGCYFVVGSLTIRFRKELRLWQQFTVHTQIVGWDDKAFYIEQQLVNNKDKFIHAVAVVKQVLVGASPAELLAELGEKITTSPPIPDRIQLLIEHDVKSSEHLRPTQ